MRWTELTLIVPTKNEALNIGRFLAAIPADIRIIVVDASTDNTLDIVRQTGRTAIRVLRDGGNIAAARQLASEAARTEWLLFTDADVLFAQDYFTALEKIQPDPRQGGIAGAKLSRGRHRLYYHLFSLWLRLCCAVGLPAATGSNMLVRREALLRAGGFDPRLSCNEDSELMWRLHRRGYRIDYAGTLRVYEFDHRRLDDGVLRKTLHSLTRCALLFSGLLHDTLRTHDWGYWRKGAGDKSKAP
jgi:glycosyltransferase involved in cell wall biosynthesis